MNKTTKTTKTKFYVYESGEVIGEVELSKSEWNSEKVLKSVFEKYFGDVIEDEDEFEINCDEGEIYIGLNEEMYLWNVNNSPKKSKTIKFYAYENGKCCGYYEMTEKERNTREGLKKAFGSCFGDVVKKEDVFDVKCTGKEIYIGLNEKMYFLNKKLVS